MSEESPPAPDEDAPSAPDCAFCNLPVPDAEDAGEADEPLFCSDACREAHDERDSPLPTYSETAFITTGVSAIDASLPQGMLRNSLVVVSGEPGTRGKTVLTELAWRALNRGDPVTIVTASDPPLMLLEQFLTLQWNIFPYFESGQLRIIDAYSYQNGDDAHHVSNDWDSHVEAVASNHTQHVHDPGQPSQLARHLSTAASELDMEGGGVVIIDSLTELGTLMGEVQAYNFLKNIRTEYCKARNLTVFAGSNFGGYSDEFPYEMEFLFDGIVDLALNPRIVPGLLLKEITVRKMRGVMSLREAHTFEYAEHEGMMLVNPTPPEDAEDDPKDAAASPPEGDGSNQPRTPRTGGQRDRADAPKLDDVPSEESGHLG